MGMKGVPRNYKNDPDLRAAYEEGGRAIGRIIMHHPEREEYLWKLLKGVKLWPRWYLLGFKGLYSMEHPAERQLVLDRRCRRKKRNNG